ncbi:MAG TPA: iron-containing alcohol dehydrogenase [Geminicoccaceae bacterium]|jgi:alcohol dehydrogenase class IV|nr:iron-containing alcohol dehydrogenase [Geminicoccaceae bacterium]
MSTTSLTEIPAFAVNRVPEVHFGPGRGRAIADDAARIGHPSKPVVLVADRAMVQLGVADRLTAALEAAGAEVARFDDIAGEPSELQVEAATDFVRFNAAGLVICLGGGSAMDIGKIAATIACTGDSPIDFAMERRPLPRRAVPKICLPTTAGTGSEFSSTNVFADGAHKKVWIWGPETKPERVVLDPELTVSLPPELTAWTGLDAFAHALEASTNVRQHPWTNLNAHRALHLIAGAVETAVHEPGNLVARGQMLVGAAHAGIAIDTCGCALAHNISHALAALGPVHHGLATALALEVVLPWQVAADRGAFAAAAEACGLGPDAAALPGWYSDLLTRCGVERRLPAAFREVSVAALAAEMRAPETQPMCQANVRPVGDADVDRFAAAMLALA